MKIDDLLNRYFDGNTTCEEEREIKRFFREEDVPSELEIYRPLFAFFEEEAKQYSPRRQKRYFIYTLSSIAAGLLIILSIAGIKQINQPANFVIIDGYKSTNIQLAREQAQAAFDDVSFSRDEIFETLFSE
ncbi:hypothetical protein [Bacteroides sp. 51]|uniref:hypothetical protein n=1 Tax=Bacteroides sp. 51 TaxID=2302938 RepID=UPI0013D4AEA0|nr:hypothetical protein [Bacteroides sp. 51]NDV81467.1 hypothetical protein [Bacteroides sp. 51]